RRGVGGGVRVAEVALELGVALAAATAGGVQPLVAGHGLRQLLLDERLAREQAGFADHPAQGPRGVGAAAEAEDVDLVAGHVVGGEEAVAGQDVVEQPEAERSAEDAVDAVADPDAAEVEHGLLDPRLHGGGVDLHGARDLLDVRDVLAVGAVPGAVATDDEALHPSMVALRVAQVTAAKR